MADVSPFLSTHRQWIKEIASLREESKKIEEKSDRLKTKLRSYLDEKKLDELAADKFVARIERRETTDFSQKTLTEHLGAKKFAALKAALPVKVSEALTIREIKKEEDKPASDLPDKLASHFGGKK